MRGYSQRLREYPFFSCLALGVPRPKARKMKRKIKTVRLLANFFRDEYYEAYKELIRQLSPKLQNPDTFPEEPRNLSIIISPGYYSRAMVFSGSPTAVTTSTAGWPDIPTSGPRSAP